MHNIMYNRLKSLAITLEHVTQAKLALATAITNLKIAGKKPSSKMVALLELNKVHKYHELAFTPLNTDGLEIGAHIMDVKLYKLHEYLGKHVFDIPIATNKQHNKTIAQCACGCLCLTTPPNTKWTVVSASWIADVDSYVGWVFHIPFNKYIEQAKTLLDYQRKQ